MATTPTSNPIPSETPQDLKFNAGKIDEFVTSKEWTYTDRFGIKRYTIEGINYLAQQVMSAFGYVTLQGVTFTTGATIYNPNEVLFNTADNSYYKWTGSFSSGEKVVPANSTPNSTGGVGPGKWLSVGDTVLRNDMASSADGEGDELITVKQPYSGAVATTQHKVNQLLVNILDFEGKGDGEKDNADPLRYASDAVGDGGIIYFPAVGGNNYKLGASTLASWTANRVIKTDPNVTITTVANGYIHETTKFANEVKGYFSEQNVDFYYPASFNINKSDRPIWVSSSDRDVSTLQQIQPNSNDINVGPKYRVFNQTSDTVGPFNPVATSISGYQLANGNVNEQQVAMVHLNDGDELSAYFGAPTGTAPVCVVMIRATGARYWYTCAANALDNPVRQTKPIGGNVSSTGIGYQGMDTTPAYKFYNSDITIRRNTKTNYSILLNGFTIDKVELPLSHGEIIEVGFGMSGNGGITVSDPVRRINGPKDNGQFLNVCVFGDSITAESMNGGWPRILRSSFDAVNGIRFPKVDNYAVAGADSASQLVKMNTVNLSNYNLCLIMLGVNDIQGGVTGNSFLANMTTMINNAANNGCTVIVSAPTMFYGQAQSGGKGQPTTRSDEGRYHRTGIRRLCASMGIKFIDTNQVIGPVLPDYVNSTLNPSLAASGDDQTLNDNIHGTPNTKYLIARAFYNAIAGIYSARSSLTTPETPLNGDLVANWTHGSGSDLARWYRDESGVVHLDGILNYSGSTPPSNGAIIYRLPAILRPANTTRAVVWADAVTARLIISSDGGITIYGMTSGSWCSLSGISFKGMV